MYCYSNNGTSMRAVEKDYQAAAGEVLSVSLMSADELQAAFPAYAQAQAQAATLQQAMDALDASDMTALRCLKAGVTFPAEWQTYVGALRTIVQNGGAGEMPAQPAYPAGT